MPLSASKKEAVRVFVKVSLNERVNAVILAIPTNE